MLCAALGLLGPVVSGVAVWQGKPVFSCTQLILNPNQNPPSLITGGRVTRTFEFHQGLDWKECVPSWNVGPASEDRIKLICFPYANKELEAGFLTSEWKRSESPEDHFSMKNQKFPCGELQTDTIVLKSLHRELAVEVGLTSPEGQPEDKLTLVGVNFFNPDFPDPADLSDRAVWGKPPLNVPQRSQMSYEHGDVLCSPTSISMLLAYWAKVLGRMDLDRDVPAAAAGVYDKNWPGTGNWSFNVAFVGSMPGMRAYVDRMQGVCDLEKWIGAGVPLACSVSYDLLRGRGKKGPNDGHLVVLVGFESNGDVVVNDPGRSTETRQVYRRKDFRAAWRTSGRTAYVAFPRGWSIPAESRVRAN